ncbi:hypothetical protein B0H14DRAFT_3092520 [Mycena olivaceomarginata]|nr:hypothetical protein B0H14DRAFT_3092520 [Mycena olivaceomarginata]
MSSDKKVILITGANTGLGYEIVKALYATSVPYEIIIGSRTLSKADDAIKVLQSEIDVSSDTSLEAAVKTVEGRHGRIDILINNAGATFDGAVQDGTMSLREAFNASWDTNVSGTHVLTTLAAPLLLKSADPRLLFITSGTSSMTETDPSMWGTVPTLARLNASPAKGWPKPHTLVSFPTPGFLATGLGGAGKEQLLKMGALEPHIGGEFVRDVVEGKRDHDAGKAIRSNMVQPW